MAIGDIDSAAAAPILVVEDEPEIRKVIGAFLEHQGYAAVVAEDAAAALAALEDQHFELLITDVIMPDMNGPDLYKAALDRQHGLKVLFISGYTEDVLSDLGAEGIEFSFLAKPFSIAQLGKAVEESLAR